MSVDRLKAAGRAVGALDPMIRTSAGHAGQDSLPIQIGPLNQTRQVQPMTSAMAWIIEPVGRPIVTQ